MKRIVSLFIALIFLLNTTLAYTLKVTVKGIDLVVTREAGNEIELEAKAEDIIGWEVKKGDITITDNSFIMPEEDVEIEAIIAKELGTYSLVVETPFLTRREDKIEEQSVTVEATSTEDNEFYKWKATGITLTEEQEKSSTLTFTMPGNDVTLEAVYQMISLSWDTTGQLTKTLTLRTTAETIVNWGDGTKETYPASPSADQTITHTYASAQEYTVKLQGDYNITQFNCPDSKISKLDVRNCTELQVLKCYTNNIRKLDVSNNTKLINLQCYTNNISKLDVSKNLLLQTFICAENNISSLDVTRNTELTYLSCRDNNISSIDLIYNEKLETLAVQNNTLTSLDVSRASNLKTLSCSNNPIGSIDVTYNVALENLYAENNGLTEIALEYNLNLKKAYLANNSLTMLDINSNNLLEELSVHDNNLTDLHIRNQPELTYLEFGNNRLYDYIDVCVNTKLKELWGYNNSLQEILGLSNLTQLEILCVHTNRLTTLDVTNNPNLTYLNFGTNEISSIDLSNNENLVRLYGYNCELENVDETWLENNLALVELNLQYNYITELHIEKNINLSRISCYEWDQNFFNAPLQKLYVNPTQNTFTICNSPFSSGEDSNANMQDNTIYIYDASVIQVVSE